MLARRIPLDLSSFFQNENFSDISIVSKSEGEESRKFSCHKIVLCAASKFFERSLMNKNDETSETLIVPLKGHQLEKALEFIYVGQTVIENTDVPSFMETLMFLEMETNAGNDDPTRTDDYGVDPTLPSTSDDGPKRKKLKKEVKNDPDGTQNDQVDTKPDVKPNLGPKSFDKIDEHTVPKLIKIDSESGKPFCLLCDRKFASKQNVKDHIRAKHIGRADIKCLYCQNMFITMDQRNQHINKQHKEEHRLAKVLKSNPMNQ